MTTGMDPLTVQLDELVSWILATVGHGLVILYIAYRIFLAFRRFQVYPWSMIMARHSVP